MLVGLIKLSCNRKLYWSKNKLNLGYCFFSKRSKLLILKQRKWSIQVSLEDSVNHMNWFKFSWTILTSFMIVVWQLYDSWVYIILYCIYLQLRLEEQAKHNTMFAYLLLEEVKNGGNLGQRNTSNIMLLKIFHLRH